MLGEIQLKYAAQIEMIWQPRVFLTKPISRQQGA